ncbi:uncharacterized protein K444DRAFT_629322 [Hyaloscypha bicolor E]|uniref:Secreted protein n=1 Tax=Hyaloscypha bicolor E TaxID=1095630 RepID=A0A2J6TBE4_9HELO|nr:uncharacterized protein K444DRAFT_629322 [Hyaloscypha bicolor E]PMD60341.1 hypothetical protein K444DRAFT_629322 [Hyaloscypha bicolor E]
MRGMLGVVLELCCVVLALCSLRKRCAGGQGAEWRASGSRRESWGRKAHCERIRKYYSSSPGRLDLLPSGLTPASRSTAARRRSMCEPRAWRGEAPARLALTFVAVSSREGAGAESY